MYRLVDNMSDSDSQLRTGSSVRYLFKKRIDWRSRLEMYATFIPRNTGSHIFQIIGRLFLVSDIIAFELHLLRFEIITRVVFIRNGNRHEIQSPDIGKEISPTA